MKALTVTDGSCFTDGRDPDRRALSEIDRRSVNALRCNRSMEGLPPSIPLNQPVNRRIQRALQQGIKIEGTTRSINRDPVCSGSD